MTIIPPLLKSGDKIAIIAPGRKVKPPDVAVAVDIFRSWGLEVKCAANLHSNSHSYLAGSDEERLADFQQALDDPTVKAIICARGGYGSTRILDQVDLSILKKNRKWLIGFSDVTAIHLSLCTRGIASIHATMPILFGRADSQVSIESLKHILFNGEYAIQGESHVKNRVGSGSGKMLGGNLSLIADSLGTASEPDTTNSILVIEEIDEYLYKVDRMMMQLKRAGKLDHLQALIVGHMTDIKDTELPFGESVHDIILRTVREYNYPIIFGFPSGHENPNLAWIHGTSASISVNESNFSVQSASSNS
jgi:muramoyltetrapeptide carboxypeptidase